MINAAVFSPQGGRDLENSNFPSGQVIPLGNIMPNSSLLERAMLRNIHDASGIQLKSLTEFPITNPLGKIDPFQRLQNSLDELGQSLKPVINFVETVKRSLEGQFEQITANLQRGANVNPFMNEMGQEIAAEIFGNGIMQAGSAAMPIIGSIAASVLTSLGLNMHNFAQADQMKISNINNPAPIVQVDNSPVSQGQPIDNQQILVAPSISNITVSAKRISK